MKIVITGGHLSPGLALVSSLVPPHEVLFIGRKHAFEGDDTLSFEYQALADAKIPFRTITTGRLQRHLSMHTISSLMKFPIGFFQSWKMLLWYKPQVVLSFGSYVSLPVCLAAFLLGIPVVTHEQTASNAGLANRIIAAFAKKVCLGFKESKAYFPSSKTVITGNPIRKELLTLKGKAPPELLKKNSNTLPVIYVTGGSGGSRSINLLIAEILDKLLTKYIVIHQTGGIKEYAHPLPQKHQERYIQRQFVSTSELAWIYRHAALLVGRSGINTVEEILTFGIPALLIPLPWAADSEQEKNAQLVLRVGLGKILVQKNLTAFSLFAAIEDMIKSKKIRKSHSLTASFTPRNNADQKIRTILEAVVKNNA